VTETVPAATNRVVDRVGLLHALALTSGLFLVSWLRHRNGWTGFDLAIFDQGAWQLSEGRAHISIVERHVLADHFSPVMYLFGALYRLAPSPAWLLGVQAVALGATVLPMRAIARHFGQPPGRATFLVAASSPLLAAGLFDFHPSTLAAPVIALAILYGLEDRAAPAVLAAVAVAVCRADLAPVIVAVALVATPRVRWRLLVVALGSLVASSVLPAHFGDTTDAWGTYFGHLGDGPLDAALHPWRIVSQLASNASIAFLWLAAAGLAVLRRPRWVIAVLVAGLPVLLSQWKGTGLPWYHYGAPIAPIAIAGTLSGLGSMPEHADVWSRRLAAAWWGAALIVLAVASPWSPAAPESNRIWTVAFGDDGRDLSGALALVGPDESVSADQRALPHLSQRELAYLYPIPFAPAPDFFPPGSEPDLDRYPDGHVDVVVAPAGQEGLVPSERYEVVARLEGFVVLRRIEEDP
jgi:uncharacterized membrane protein